MNVNSLRNTNMLETRGTVAPHGHLPGDVSVPTRLTTLDSCGIWCANYCCVPILLAFMTSPFALRVGLAQYLQTMHAQCSHAALLH